MSIDPADNTFAGSVNFPAPDGQINGSEIGKNADQDFRAAYRTWLMPTERVNN